VNEVGQKNRSYLQKLKRKLDKSSKTYQEAILKCVSSFKHSSARKKIQRSGALAIAIEYGILTKVTTLMIFYIIDTAPKVIKTKELEISAVFPD